MANTVDADFARNPAHADRSPRALANAGKLWRQLTESLFVGYRPERHYMRGPGPKWHARNSPPQTGLPWPGDRLP
jgi:hypothetical protein